MQDSKYKYLMNIDSPKDLRRLPTSALSQVSDEVREFMVDTITKTGGHFGAGLGIVELTVALHYVFNTPEDKIVFDTGHQGYPHKILTGRRDRLHTIRQKNGLSGFLKRTESEYDVFGAGHASTSISAALGIAVGRDYNNEDYKVVSVIGDGAMTGGLAFEAMNNCGVQKRNILVILNDNDFSIAPNVSAFSNYFNEVFAAPPLRKLRENIWHVTGKMDQFGDRLRKIASKIEDGVKAIITPGVLFEALGFNYIGPINGNNITKLVKMLSSIKELSGPVFFHIVTHKGYGYAPAEKDRQNFHAIGSIDKATGKSLKSTSLVKKAPSYQNVFGQAMVELCKKNPKIVGITAAMPDGTGLDIVQKEFPDRVIDVGIAEGHAVTFSSGLASEGIVPVVAIYSTFLQRAYDHVAHDCALQKLHIVYCLDRAGVVGSDGPTHHGLLDMAYMRTIQNMVVMAPKDEQELRNMMYSAVYDFTEGPVSIRYPRGSAVGVPLLPMESIELGKSETLLKGNDIAILAIGKTVNEAIKAALILGTMGISAEVVNARFVKPIDSEMVADICDRFKKIITVEDGTVQGGFGSAVLEVMALKRITDVEVMVHGISDDLVHHATQEEQYELLNLDGKGIAEKAIEFLQ